MWFPFHRKTNTSLAIPEIPLDPYWIPYERGIARELSPRDKVLRTKRNERETLWRREMWLATREPDWYRLRCRTCNSFLNEGGFVINGGDYFFCNDHEPEDMDELFEEFPDENYWTEWEADEIREAVAPYVILYNQYFEEVA